MERVRKSGPRLWREAAEIIQYAEKFSFDARATGGRKMFADADVHPGYVTQRLTSNNANECFQRAYGDIALH